MTDGAKPYSKVTQLTRAARRASRRTPEQVAAAMAWHRETLAQPVTICADDDDTLAIAVRRYDVQAHHVIPQQTLRRKARDLGLDEDALVWDARVGVPLSRHRHERHHSAVEPLRWDELPADRQYFVKMFAIRYGLEGWLARHVPGFE